jgi:peptide/nickel transport system substrate-binding protein
MASLIVIVSLVLAACGPTPAPSEPTQAAAPTAAAEQPTAAPQPTEEPAAAGPAMGGTMTIGLNQEPPTMDPHASPSAITFYMMSSVGETLLYLDGDREFHPWLAKDWEINDDATEYTFYLRDDVTFQDGTPFNAEAVKWNFDRIVDPNFSAGGALSALEGYVETEVVDDYTAVVKFDSPFMPFITYAAGGTLAMLSPTATQEQGDLVNETPVTSGPYQVTQYDSKSQVTIKRWDDYNRTPPWADHEGPGYLDEIIFKIIPESGTRVATVESGETQVIAEVPFQDLPRFESSDEFTVMKKAWVGAPRQWMLIVTKPPTDDLLVRQALNYGINKGELMDTLFKGIGMPPVGPLTASLLDDPELRAYYPYDPDKAAELLDEAGWSVIGADGMRSNADGEPLKIEINSIEYGGVPRELDQWTQGQLIKLGIDATLKVQARPPWYEDNYNCATNGPIMLWRSGDWDGLFPLYDSSRVGGNFGWTCIKDADIDRLLLEGRGESDLEKRRAIYLELSKKILDEALIVPFVDELAVWAMHKDVEGLKFNGFTYPIVADLHYVE